MSNITANVAGVASNSGSIVGHAIDYIDALGLATKITTVIGLAALAVIAAFLLSRQWLATRNELVAKAIDAHDDRTLSTILTGIAVGDLSGLTADQKYALSQQQLKQRFWMDIAKVGSVFFAFLALLGFISVILSGPRSDTGPMPPSPNGSPVPPNPLTTTDISTANLLKLLLTFQPTERIAMCELVRPKDWCAIVVAGIADIPQVKLDRAQQVQVASALQKNEAPLALLKSVTANPGIGEIVSLARPNAWNVDVFWCRGGGDDERLARAKAAAAALNGQSRDGVTIGRLRVRALETPRQGNGLPSAGDGSLIRVDDTPGKIHAVDVMRSILAASPMQLNYSTSETRSNIPNYVSLFECS